MPLGNNYKHQKMQGNVNHASAAFKIALMASGFTFDPDTHDNWSNVSANELAAGNGYVAGGAALSGGALTRDNTNDRVDRTWSNAVWNASGGNIGPAAGYLIYVDTGTPTTSIVCGYEPFAQDLTAFDGNPFTITSPILRES